MYTYLYKEYMNIGVLHVSITNYTCTCTFTCIKNSNESTVGVTPILSSITTVTNSSPSISVVSNGMYHLGVEQSLHIYTHTKQSSIIISFEIYVYM